MGAPSRHWLLSSSSDRDAILREVHTGQGPTAVRDAEVSVIRSTFNGDDWCSERKNLPSSIDDDEVDFERSSAWQSYLSEYRGNDYFVMLVVDDRSTFSIRTRRREGRRTMVTVGVPAEMFLGDRAKQDVYREIKLQTYQWLAKKYGWPEPPPLPPLTVRRTYRKNYKPPSDE